MMEKNTLVGLKKYQKVDNFNAICNAIMNMDSNALNDLLSEEIIYEDLGKQKFILKLRRTFIRYILKGDTKFNLDLDSCNYCNCNEPVCKFIGNNSNEHFALYFHFENNEIIDIYHCLNHGEKGI